MGTLSIYSTQSVSTCVTLCLKMCLCALMCVFVFLRQPVTLVVDQGGGSFTAYLFGPGAKQLQKFKSYNVRRVGLE